MAKTESTSSKPAVSEKKASETKTSSSKASNEGSNLNTLVMITLVLVVFQLIVLFGIVISFESKLNNLVGSEASGEKLANIEQKVNALDNFFASNVDGYGSGSNNGGTNTGGQVAPAEIDISGEPQIGNPDAKVVVVEFSDYECPFCGRFYDDAIAQLKEDYIETGKILFVYKDFPLSFHPEAKPAAIAANCVLDQLGDEKYFEYHDVLFENQQSLSESNYMKWASELGVDSLQFESCLDDSEMADEVDGDFAEGAQLGVSGTPSTFINGNLIVGAQPYSVIKQAIEAELEKE